jgi:putative ABC transport system permease protein
LVLPPLKERLLSFLPFIVGFYFLAFSEVKSFYIAAGFVLGLLSSIGLLFVMGNFLIHLMGRITSNITSQVSRPRFWIRFAFLNLSRRSFSTGLSISALGLGCLLINLIPQVRASLQGELVPGSGTKLPSFFLFDIQDDQAEELKALAFQNGFQVESLSPNVRSRLTHLNGEEIEKASFSKKAFTREEEQSARSRNRGFNLSYREELHPSETITKGKELSQELSSDGVAEISVEREFAKRLEWNVGDLVTFDIQGIPVEAKIVNLRKVKWTAFVPNFFILFQGGVLDDAPKTFLATIPQLPNDEKKFAVQEIIVDRLPNVSIVDVTRTVSMILDVMSSMTQILTIMAWLSVLAGLFVLAAIFLRLASVRKGDFNLVRVLGGSARFQGKSIAMELVALSFLAAVIGVLLSWVLGFLVVEMIFEIPFAVDLAFNALSVFSVTAIGLTIGWFTMGRLLKVTPREVFQGVD